MELLVHWRDIQGFSRVKNALSASGVVLGTTDTVVGLLALANQKGLNQLNDLKGRTDKPYLVLVGSLEQVYALIDQEGISEGQKARQDRLMQAVWPGPVTLVFKAHINVSSSMRGPDGTIALRLPDHKELQQLAIDLGPLFSTSANRAGQEAPATMEQVDPFFVENSAVCVGDIQECAADETAPSVIIDCSKDTCTLVRAGAGLLEDELQLLLNE